MFERFTVPARTVVVRAQEEAQALRHPAIGTGHLLLALLDDGTGVAGAVLRAAGADRASVREALRGDAPAEDDTAEEGPLGAEDAAALKAIGIDLDAVRAKVEQIFGPGALATPQAPPPRRGFGARRGGARPFTRRARKVLELALREAIVLRSRSIGTEHLLLGLLREERGEAAQVLTGRGLSLADLRRRTLDALAAAA
jgi:ATP-dependent Clp protease ATP-binding subunit ClpA